MGEDVKSMLQAQQICVLMDSNPVDGVPEINELNLVLGQLSWDDRSLMENLACFLEAIKVGKSSRISGALISCI